MNRLVIDRHKACSLNQDTTSFIVCKSWTAELNFQYGRNLFNQINLF